jgi:Pin2-interacting protein X1
LRTLNHRRRNKISQDPNNTNWSRSTDTYGHKILSAQGWKPGDYLGATNATHAEHYTGASASHIKALLREENLGLGAQVGKVNAETFGLSLFSGVLGRLNGKSDVEVQKHQNALRDAELRMYQANKYGNMNFVSGGFLVGDRIESSMTSKKAVSKNKTPKATEPEDKPNLNSQDEVEPNSAEPRRKKRKMNSKEREAAVEVEVASQQTSDSNDEADEPKAKQKDSKRTKSSKKAKTSTEDDTPDDERSRRKQERRARKEERRKRKADKRRSKSDAPPEVVASREGHSIGKAAKNPSAKPSSGIFAGSRHAVRQRYIQQKRMASMDPKAIKEIFMLQPLPTPA